MLPTAVFSRKGRIPTSIPGFRLERDLSPHPEGITLPRKIAIFIQFYPKENYAKAGLSWPDNYFAPSTSLRFNRKRAHSMTSGPGCPIPTPT